jgi:starch-binding outer membrane protein, SusD/RagB family
MTTFRPFRIWLAAAVILAAGCDHLLDVEPETAIDSELAIQTPADAENALVGAYNRMKQNTVYANYQNMIGELVAHSEELIFSGTFDGLNQIYNKVQVPSNEFVTRMYLDAYQAIDAANVVIARAPDVIADAAERDRVVGEARFLRGIVYLYLVRFFAPPWNSGDPSQRPGLALELEPTTAVTEELFRPRSSLADTYGQILADLQYAEGVLPATPHRRGRATTFAASAFLSQVYLAQGRFAEAAEAANRVIEEGPYQLTATYAGAFNNSDDSSEDVFAIQQTPTSTAGGNITFYASLPGDLGRGDMDITQAHLDLYEAGDDRLDLFYAGTGRKAGIPRTGKWVEQYTSVPIIRLAEMYLTRAEANHRTGGAVGPNTPLEDVNIIRDRVGLLPLATVTLEAILRERHLELAWEGHTLLDLKRTGRSVTHLGTEFTHDHPRLVLPIPQRELDVNPNLQQNAGY